ncbi:relaxase/mobilization nuclease domain-containing protein [Mucilaginibacter sp. Bleaf8]|uniref:relaxase/mobilization nuclease domain-containing protein n=1 Tax=Mucilaginibacter sp. Bleaf8 TaxID=2834430 RepID=UPI001BCFD42D|nr:relaxase/mobilization nuclease domain-containing protein [Mucilaginibacter sp. Bleaf8]MBS7565648.1 relaxase/mobilization nuclease domain-containing protein [Mucilaginibacter sp. Bleaf8]
MIASQKIGKSFMGALDYNLKKLCHPDPDQRAELLDMSFVALERRSIRAQVEVVKMLKPALKRHVYHTSLNFSKEEVAVLDNDKLLAIAHDYLNGMGFTNNQYLVFRHYDAEHPHVHLLVNRISFDGSVVSDSNNYKRSEALVRKLEKAYNLIAVEQSNYKAVEHSNYIPTGLQINRTTVQQISGAIKQDNSGTVEQGSSIATEQQNYISERAPTKNELKMIERTGKVSDKMLLQELLKTLLQERHEDLQAFIRKGEHAGIHFLFNQSPATGRITGITYFYESFKVTGKALGNKFKWGEIAKQINYEQSRDSAAAGQATSRTKAKYGEFSAARTRQLSAGKGIVSAVRSIETDRVAYTEQRESNGPVNGPAAASDGEGEYAGASREHAASEDQESVSISQDNMGDRYNDTWLWSYTGIQIADDEDDALKRRRKSRGR